MMKTMLRLCAVLIVLQSCLVVSLAQSIVLDFKVKVNRNYYRQFRFDRDQVEKFHDCLCNTSSEICTSYASFSKVYNTISETREPTETPPQAYSTRYLCRSARYGQYMRCERQTLDSDQCSADVTFALYKLRDRTHTCEGQPLEITWAADQPLEGRFDTNTLNIQSPKQGECTPITVTTTSTTKLPTSTVTMQSTDNEQLATSTTPPDESQSNSTFNASRMEVPFDKPSDDTGDNTALLAGVVAGIIAVVIVCGLVAALIWTKRHKKPADKSTNPTRSYSFVSSYSSSISRPSGVGENSSDPIPAPSSPVYLNTNGDMVYSNTKDTNAKMNTDVNRDAQMHTVITDPNMNTIYSNDEIVDSVYSNDPGHDNSRNDSTPNAVDVGNLNYSEVEIDRTNSRSTPVQVVTESSKENALDYYNTRGPKKDVYAVVQKNKVSDQVSKSPVTTRSFQIVDASVGKDPEDGLCYEEVNSAKDGIVYSEVDLVDRNVYNDVDEDVPCGYTNHGKMPSSASHNAVTKDTRHNDTNNVGKFQENDEGYATAEQENTYSHLHEKPHHITDIYNCAADWTDSSRDPPFVSTSSSHAPDVYSLAQPIENPRTTPVQVIDVRPFRVEEKVKCQGTGNELQPMGRANVYFELESDADVTCESIQSADLTY